MSKKTSSTLWTIFSILIFVMLFWGKYFIGIIGVNFTYSEGDRVGTVIKLSEKGVFWKTWEGELMLSQSGGYGEIWEFSIDRKDKDNQEKFLELLVEAYENGDIAKVHYKQRYGTLPWRGQTSYFIDDVTEVSPSLFSR